MKKKLWIFIIAAVFVLGGIGAIGFFSKNEKKEDADQTSAIEQQVAEYQGYIRVISQEEYDFYSYFVKRDLGEEVTEEELDLLIRDYAAKISGIFYLGNRFGICGPYSFESLELEMEQENISRQVKAEQGEAIYGVQEFTLNTYFLYKLDSVELAIINYIEANADDVIWAEAERYYQENEDLYITRDSVTYECVIGEEKEITTADRDQLNLLGKSEPGLADFLEAAEIGDEYSDLNNGEERKIVVTDITYLEPTFELYKDQAMLNYLEGKLYPQLLETVIEQNPVEFE